jgi:hypothetical protein
MQFKICRDCGAHLDSGESCDCQKEKAAPMMTEAASQKDYSKPTIKLPPSERLVKEALSL